MIASIKPTCQISVNLLHTLYIRKNLEIYPFEVQPCLRLLLVTVRYFLHILETHRMCTVEVVLETNGTNKEECVHLTLSAIFSFVAAVVFLYQVNCC